MFFKRKFQLMMSIVVNSFLSVNQKNNQFLVQVDIEL